MGLENPIHLLLVLVVVLMVFGAKKLPEMGTSLGSGLRGESIGSRRPMVSYKSDPSPSPDSRSTARMR